LNVVKYILILKIDHIKLGILISILNLKLKNVQKLANLLCSQWCNYRKNSF